MVSSTTNSIKVSVSAIYHAEYSNPLQEYFVFAYHIIIENTGSEAVKLLRRHWFIFDSSGLKSEVEGEGVVGETPLIRPGERYEYVSGCNLKTDIGSMKGYYQMHQETTGELLEVEIPEFQLIGQYRLN